MARLVFGLAATLACAGALAAQPADGVGQTARRIELHYNRLATFQTEFEQKQTYHGRELDLERGRLYLLRPQKMRWEYSRPEGKLLVGDGRVLETYNPYTNQTRKIRFDSSADLRAPLSFLLGRLDFSRQFKNLRFEDRDGRRVLVGEGRTGQEAYSSVEFHFEPEEDYRLSALKVFGRDESITEFRFWNEETNRPLGAELFVFVAPDGAEILPETSLEGGR